MTDDTWNRMKLAEAKVDRLRLTLRAQFAMAALTGITAAGAVGISMNVIAKESYELADAMLEARKQ